MKKIDMTYRFIWDTEPTDEQLSVIMRGATGIQGTAGIVSEKNKKKILEQIQKDFDNIKSKMDIL